MLMCIPQQKLFVEVGSTYLKEWPLPDGQLQPRPTIDMATTLSHQQTSEAQHGSKSQSKLYAASEETFQGRLKGELRFSEIDVELDRKNYKRKFNNLICWEERAHIERLREK
jgi:hypothetical protein